VLVRSWRSTNECGASPPVIGKWNDGRKLFRVEDGFPPEHRLIPINKVNHEKGVEPNMLLRKFVIGTGKLREGAENC